MLRNIVDFILEGKENVINENQNKIIDFLLENLKKLSAETQRELYIEPSEEELSLIEQVENRKQFMKFNFGEISKNMTNIKERLNKISSNQNKNTLERKILKERLTHLMFNINRMHNKFSYLRIISKQARKISLAIKEKQKEPIEILSYESPFSSQVILQAINPEIVHLFIGDNYKKQNLREFKLKFHGTIERKLIDILIYQDIDQEIINHPLSIFWRITEMLRKEKYDDAAIFLINNYEKLYIDNNEIIKELIFIQTELIRHLFKQKKLYLLEYLIYIDFYKLTQDDELKAKFLLVAGCGAIGVRHFIKAEECFYESYKMTKQSKKKAKASYMLGSLYEYLETISEHKEYKEKKTHWFNLSAKEINCLWSMVSRGKINQKVHCVSIKKLSKEHENPSGDRILQRAKELWDNNEHLKSIKFIYSIRSEHLKRISKNMIECIEFFINHKRKEAMYRIGITCFKYTGMIIKECFAYPNYLSAALQCNVLSQDEAIKLMAITSEESKLLDHSYYNLDTPTGLGIFQINPTEIVKLAKKMKIPYNKKEFLNNPFLQTKMAISLFRHHKKMVGNNLIFSLLYYVAGHQSYISLKSNLFLRINYPLHSFVILSLFTCKRTRRYIIGVIEFMILLSVVHYKKIPQIDFLLNHSKFI